MEIRNMKVYCLASSSSGNCYVMDFDINGTHTLLMVECGLPYNEIVSRCNKNGIDLSKINSCLITHAHSDHSKAAKELQKRGVRIWASKETLGIIALQGQELALNTPKNVEKGVCVMPFKVEHDIDGAVGFVIKTEKETVIFINDCKKWNDNLINFKPDYVFIECNYNQKMVYAQLHEFKEMNECDIPELERKENNIKIKQHERNIDAHMSLHGCLVGLSKLNLRYCKMICLMHLSDRYANEFLMKNEVMRQTGVRTYVCQKSGGIK